MAASLFTCSGASVGVSISTQRRMPSRMILQSKGLAVVSMMLPAIVIPGCAAGRRPGIWRLQMISGFAPSRLSPTWIVILPHSVTPGSLASLAPRNDDLLSALVRFFASGNLFDQIDNTAPELAVGNARERAG